MPPCMSVAGTKEEVCFCHWATEFRATEQTAGLISHSVGKSRIQQTARAEGSLHGFWQRNNAGLPSVQRQGPGLALETAGTKHRWDALEPAPHPAVVHSEEHRIQGQNPPLLLGEPHGKFIFSVSVLWSITRGHLHGEEKPHVLIYFLK